VNRCAAQKLAVEPLFLAAMSGVVPLVTLVVLPNSKELGWVEIVAGAELTLGWAGEGTCPYVNRVGRLGQV
jgi:hypothetical protein